MDLPLHPATGQQLQQLIDAPIGSYILHGPAGSGKRLVAQWLAQRLNCLGDGSGPCRHCQAIAAGSYPDVVVMSHDGSLKLEMMRDFIRILSLKPYHTNGYRVMVLDAGTGLSTEAQNALLKTLEEPPERSVLLVLVSDLGELLPTVRSRCRSIYIAPPPVVAVEQWLGQMGIAAAPARQAVTLAAGRPGLALQLTQDPELSQGYTAALSTTTQLLAQSRFDRLVAVKPLTQQPGQARLVVRSLFTHIQAVARSQPTPGLVAILEALEQFERRIRANVTIKTALESLVLELPQ